MAGTESAGTAAIDSGLAAWPQAVSEAYDAATGRHAERVRRHALALARVLGIQNGPLIDAIDVAALLHDIGKSAVPPDVLNKRGPLTEAEFDVVKRHVDVGADMIEQLAWPSAAAVIVRSHHENWDGTGYTRGLKGRAIPFGARIVSVVDCFDALTSDRPYRARLTPREAVEIIKSRCGTMYDPGVVDAFVHAL